MKEQNIEWFKNEIEPNLIGYELKYGYWESGDFGSLSQIEFNSAKLGGNIDFWGLDWLCVFLWDYEEEKELINVLLQPEEKLEKERILNYLTNFLKSKTE